LTNFLNQETGIMKRLSLLFVALVGCLVILAASPSVDAQKDDPKPGKKKPKGGIPAEYRKNVEKGLDWLKDAQEPDGHWGSDKGNPQYKMAMTGLTGVALLMEGSTEKTGKYAKNIRKAVDWCLARAQKGKGDGKFGLISDTDDPQERVRYMYGHGFATLFLACAYGDMRDKKHQDTVKEVLTNAVQYIGKAQSSIGGFYYTSKLEGGDNDEGSVTVTQVQALRACKNAGIPVPNEIIKKSQDYLHKSTTQAGGVLYRCPKGVGAPAFGGERPALTAAAIACGFSAGDYKSEVVKKWFKFCKDKIGFGVNATGHDDYTQYYYAQAVYMLGDDGWEELFGKTPVADRLTWTEYRKHMFKFLANAQNQNDGSWQPRGGWGVGRVFATAINCSIMQLDKGTLPIHQR
jgi:hypothetical protein